LTSTPEQRHKEIEDLRQPLKIQETRPVIASEAKQSTLLNEKQRLLRRFTPRNDGARLFLEIALRFIGTGGKEYRILNNEF
jgi:ABC-type ATPase with predicted acetyltransferase domain